MALKDDFVSTTPHVWLVAVRGPVLKTCYHRVDLSGTRKGSGRNKSWDLVAVEMDSGGEGQEGGIGLTGIRGGEGSVDDEEGEVQKRDTDPADNNDGGGLAQAVGAEGVEHLAGDFSLVHVSGAEGSGEGKDLDEVHGEIVVAGGRKRPRIESSDEADPPPAWKRSYPVANSVAARVARVRAARLLELEELSVKELKAGIVKRGGIIEDCVEKCDLVNRLAAMKEAGESAGNESKSCKCVVS